MSLLNPFGPATGGRDIAAVRRARPRLAVEALDERINPDCGCPHLPPSQISGLVYFDQNKDGVAQDSEPRLEGVTVTLSGLTADGDHVTLTATTDAGGIFMFQGLEAGTYKLKVTTPTGYTPGQSSVGAFGGNTAANVITGIVIPQGQSSGAYNFGELVHRPAASLDHPDDHGHHYGQNKEKGNNGVGNGVDPQPPGAPPINDDTDTSPGLPGSRTRNV